MNTASATHDGGHQPFFYNITNAEKYEALNIADICENEPATFNAAMATRVEEPEGGVAEGGLECRRRRLRRCIVYNRYTGYIYYWYWCYA